MKSNIAIERSAGRQVLPAGGSFMSVPSAYTSVNEAVRDALKLESWPTIDGDGRIGLMMSTDRVLIDFAAVDPARFDIAAIAADCEIVRDAVRQYPEGVREILEGLRANSVDGINRAADAVRKMGLTEDAVQSAGGGLFFLVVVVVAAAATSGCVKRGTKPGDELTTPGHGVGTVPGDAGSGDAGGGSGGSPPR